MPRFSDRGRRLPRTTISDPLWCEALKSSKVGAALNPRRERGPDLNPRRSPERPPEVGADITPGNCDLSETQCVGLPNYLDCCCRSTHVL
jgi:hypothetical protein